MNSVGRGNLRFYGAILAFAVCLLIVWPVAFKRGEAHGRMKTQVSVANDGAFYCLSGLQALEGSDTHKLLLQICLDGEALKLSDICLNNPEWIGRDNYNLLKRVHRYLIEHSDERRTNTTLRPVGQVTTKIADALARLEALHDISEWYDPEPSPPQFKTKPE